MASSYTVFFSVLLQACSCLALGDCANRDGIGGPSPQGTEIKEELERSECNLRDVHRRIYDTLSSVEPCTNIKACETFAVTLIPKKPTPQSKGQRILVIDDGMTIPAYLRYKSRVLDHIFPFDDGSYQSAPTTVEVPIAVFQVLSEILDEQFPDTTAKELDLFSQLFYKHKKVLNEKVMHGDEIFSTLADLNPHAEFLLAGRPGVIKEDFCTSATDDAALERLRVFFRNTADSLKSYIEKYEINYVNMSFGETVRTLRADWGSYCLNQPIPNSTFFESLLKVYFEDFYEQLFTIQDVVFVQASATSTQNLSSANRNFFSDCQEVSNRIRATGFSSVNTLLPMTGTEVPELLRPEMLGALPCTDLLINFGIEASRPWSDGVFPILFTTDGIGAESLGTYASASSATPIVLSYINYLQQSGLVSGYGAEFVANLKKYHTGRFLEPARYRQFEIYRLGRQ